jgi:hypothetical protein
LKKFILIIIFSVQTAYPSTYTFSGGSCESQGSWTAEALSATQSLVGITNQLQQDENCGQLSKTLQSHFTEIRQKLDSLKIEQEKVDQVSNLKNEILSLRDFLNYPNVKENVLSLILNKTIDAATLSFTDIMSGRTENSSGINTVNNLYNLGGRVYRASEASVILLDQTMDTVLNETKCLMSPNFIGPFMSSMISLTSAFVGSGQDFFGNRIASLLNKFTTLLRGAHYANVMKQLNQTQFRNSMSCLLEVVSENYCSSVDSYHLFREEMDRHRLNPDDKKPIHFKDDLKNLSKLGFDGYYILTQQLPIVNAWIEKVQRGVEPRLESDAHFQNNVIEDVMRFYMKEKILLSTINFDKSSIEALTSVDAQRNAVLNTLSKLTEIVAGGRMDQGVKNFYTTAIIEQRIPFYLLGMAVPDVVQGKNSSGVAQSPWVWLQANMLTLPQFNNPLELLDVIRNRVRELSETAQQSAIQYYNQWFIYDQAGLTFDSLTGMIYNVRSALENINSYLLHLEQNGNLDPSVLPVLFDTRHRVANVIEQYQLLKQKGEALKKAITDEERATVLKESMNLSRNLIEVVYDQFMVLKARSGFLSNRLSNFVKYDFQNMLKNSPEKGDVSNSTVRDIYFATGDAAFEKMKLMSSKNPKNIQSDLDNAQITNKENLRALEMLLKDNFIAMMAYMKKVAEGKSVNNDDIYNDSRSRAWTDYWRETSLPHNPLAFIVAPLKIFDFFYYMNLNTNRYPRSLDTGFGINGTSGIIDNENGSAKRMLAHYCVQSLAFTEWQPFYEICKDVVLNSPYSSDHLQGSELQQFESLLNLKYKTALTEHVELEEITPISNSGFYKRSVIATTPEMLDSRNSRVAKNQTARICAMRQFTRSNYIVWITRIAPYENQN